jgi:hypothetical protein
MPMPTDQIIGYDEEVCRQRVNEVVRSTLESRSSDVLLNNTDNL